MKSAKAFHGHNAATGKQRHAGGKRSVRIAFFQMIAFPWSKRFPTHPRTACEARVGLSVKAAIGL